MFSEVFSLSQKMSDSLDSSKKMPCGKREQNDKKQPPGDYFVKHV